MGTKSRHGHASRRVACEGCGLVQVYPQPDPKEMAAYYASHDYRREYGPAALIFTGPDGSYRVQPGEPRYEHAVMRKAELEASVVASVVESIEGLKVLEVGCGEGRMLRELERMGALVTGIEPDGEAAAKATGRLERGTVHACTLEHARLDPPYDVVTAWHVVEHAFDPVDMLRRLRGLMADHGVLMIEVPDLTSPGLPVETAHFQHVHLYDFTGPTLKATLSKAGFAVQEIACGPRRPNAGSHIRAVATKGEPKDEPTGQTGGEVEAYIAGIKWATGELA